MAGSIKNSGRKQWNLQDRSLYKLRYQLAEDGCVDSQIQIARQLLEDDCDIRAIREANNRQAIHWLLRAAEQGSEEASELLDNCHREGCGVTEDNINDIKACLNMTLQEKLARKTAREIFCNLSKGSDHIKLSELNEHMIEIHNSQKGQENKEMHDSSSCNSSDCFYDNAEKQNIRVTESNLLSAAVSYANGNVPPVSQALPLSTYVCALTTKLPFTTVKISPHISLHSVCQKLLQIANISLSIFSNIHLHLLLLVYFLMNTGHLLLIIPLALYYLSFVVMTVSTFRMFEVHRSYTDFTFWSELFHYHSDGVLDSDQAEHKFLIKHAYHYKMFFIALLTHLILNPIVSKHWISHSEFAIISLCLSFSTFIVYSSCDSQNMNTRLLGLGSFVLNILAKYPYKRDSFMNKGWPVLNFDVYNISSYVFGSKVEFYLNTKAFLYTIIPGVLIMMAKMKNWQGVYRFLLPHCVTLSWFQLFIMNADGITLNGLFRVVTLFVSLIFFWPISNLASLVLPVMALDNWMSIDNIEIRMGVVIVVLCCAIYLTMFSASNEHFGTYIFGIKMLLGLVAISYLLSKSINIQSHLPKTESNLNQNIYEVQNDYGIFKFEDDKYLTWEEYQHTCLDSAWTKTNKISSQMDCFQLNGLRVNWNGYITNLKVTSVRNILVESIEVFPEFMSNYFKCFFGQKSKLDCDDEVCKSINEKIIQKNICNLDMWNRYEYEISVNLQTGILTTGPRIILQAGHDFTNFTQMLRTNDKINFKGILVTNPSQSLASIQPVIKLEEVSCINCHRIKDYYVNLTNAIQSSESIINYILICIRNVLNFILNPLLVFKPVTGF